MTVNEQLAQASGTFRLGGDLTIHRLGFGTMQLVEPGVWGGARDPREAVRVLRRAVDLGITFLDTADSYGPFTAELLVREALHPYPSGVVIATKAGFVRPGPGQWVPLGRPEYLRQQVELSLRNLALDRIDLFQLHRVDPQVPLAEQIGVLGELRVEGKIRHIGLSQVSAATLAEAGRTAPIVAVQNRYNLADRADDDVLAYAEAHDMAFIPWTPLAKGSLARPGGALARMAEERGASTSQLALAWLLRRSPALLPIPGTSSVAHLEENTAAATLELSDAEYEELASAS
ncbi:aldo/keto reductase [Streptomyces radicis]|uniref:Oxidoreductase n=1 Tax=Streptomyces radicis TaxID=1750517 RepID=A0A3A9WLJ7_9ACTN|nr:aldo/keto reductase [Streptomyces radicis]RKN07027.1 oxidoreductase [Streptomyces radicis]RKN15088.1 oxidoreductase [Streptomyces radicis]